MIEIDAPLLIPVAETKDEAVAEAELESKKPIENINYEKELEEL